MSSAHDIEAIAARYLLRKDERDWSDEDQAELDRWLSDSMAHRASYLRLAEGWRQVDRLASIGTSASEITRSRPWRSWGVAAIAAAGIGVIAVSAIFKDPVHAPLPKPSLYVTAIGASKKIAFVDGSKVELNTGTEVRARVSADGRDIWLDRGEAFFEVAHDPSRPFRVHAGARAVTVLGTKFAVKRENGQITISVLEGRVRVDDTRTHARDTSATINPGDVVLAQGSSTLVLNQTVQQIENSLSWRRGLLKFNGTTLGAAAAEFNRYNRKQLIVADKRASAIRIGGTFQAKNVEAFARLLHIAFNLDVQERRGEIEITTHRTTDF